MQFPLVFFYLFILFQLLEEMLDSDGQPLTTSPNALREIVLPPSLLSKLLSATNITASLNSNTGPAGVFASPIPWRKANVKYSSNEIYFDVIEEMDAVVNRSVCRMTAGRD
jgi:AP-3 complex subunit mu